MNTSTKIALCILFPPLILYPCLVPSWRVGDW
jgi:hypothetical protein